MYHTDRTPRPASRWLLPATLLVLLAGLARADPDLAGRAVDTARQVVGPAPIAFIEDNFYRAADAYDRLRFRLTGAGPGWQLADGASVADGGLVDTTPADAAAAVTLRPEGAGSTNATVKVAHAGAPILPVTPTRVRRTSGMAGTGSSSGPALGMRAQVSATPTSPAGSWQSTPTPGPLNSATPGPLPTLALEPLRPLSLTVTQPPLSGEGVWQPLASARTTAGQPIVWQTMYRPDPERPFARVVLVAMDTTRSQLHMVIGTNEPVSTMPANGLRTGVIPNEVQAGGQLLAAWNGGFRAVHGHFGMMTDKVTWLPAQDGLATIALRPDGSLSLGAWGRGILPAGPWAAWRQNDPPLIENGQINPDVVTYANTIRWGASVDGAVFIWRSGQGLSRDGRWLIYAAGNSLSAATLTAALKAAGAFNAMQLDVNATWERYVLYRDTPQVIQRGGQSVTLPVTAYRLIDQMTAGPTQFLVPYDRDFFFLTVR
jgi:hypothetical protein